MPTRRLAAFTAAAALLLPPAALTAQPDAAPGLDLAAMDRSVAPGEDFYAFANGTWLKTTEIPPDRSSWGAGAELVEKTDKRVADLIQEAAAKAPAGSPAGKIGDYYRTYLDEGRIDQLGLAPIRPTLARIGAIRTKPALAAELGRELRADVDAMNSTNFHTTNLFGLWVEQDLNAPGRYAPYLLQGGLGLPDRDYYLVDNPHMAGIRAAYKAHLVKVLGLMGVKDAQATAGRVYDLETRIARAHETRAESEDVKKANNPWTRAEFAAKAPGLDWSAFFAAAGLERQPRFIVWHPQAVTGEAALVASVPLSTWREYLALHQVEHFSGVLPKAFRRRALRLLRPHPQRHAAAARALEAGGGRDQHALGEAVGQLYVARYFPPQSKAAVEAMVKDLMAAFRARIERLAWMAPATKAEALQQARRR